MSLFTASKGMPSPRTTRGHARRGPRCSLWRAPWTSNSDADRHLPCAVDLGRPSGRAEAESLRPTVRARRRHRLSCPRSPQCVGRWPRRRWGEVESQMRTRRAGPALFEPGLLGHPGSLSEGAPEAGGTASRSGSQLCRNTSPANGLRHRTGGPRRARPIGADLGRPFMEPLQSGALLGAATRSPHGPRPDPHRHLALGQEIARP